MTRVWTFVVRITSVNLEIFSEFFVPHTSFYFQIRDNSEQKIHFISVFYLFQSMEKADFKLFSKIFIHVFSTLQSCASNTGHTTINFYHL